MQVKKENKCICSYEFDAMHNEIKLLNKIIENDIKPDLKIIVKWIPAAKVNMGWLGWCVKLIIVALIGMAFAIYQNRGLDISTAIPVSAEVEIDN